MGNEVAAAPVLTAAELERLYGRRAAAHMLECCGQLAGPFGYADVLPVAELYCLLRHCLPASAKDTVLWLMETTPSAESLKYAILFSSRFTSTPLALARVSAAVEVVAAAAAAAAEAPAARWASTAAAALDAGSPALARSGAALFVEYLVDSIVDAAGSAYPPCWPDMKKRIVEWYHSAFLVAASFGPVISEKIISGISERHRASVDHLLVCVILRGSLAPRRRVAQRWLRRAVVAFGLAGSETEGVFGLGLEALEAIM